MNNDGRPGSGGRFFGEMMGKKAEICRKSGKISLAIPVVLCYNPFVS